jgi:hypothetical protein
MASPPPPDHGRAFSEACNHYRFFVDLRQKLFNLFLLASFGASVVYWAIRAGAHAEGRAMDPASNWAIRLIGIGICVFCLLVDLLLGRMIGFYESRCRDYAACLGVRDFTPPRGVAGLNGVLYRCGSAAVFLAGVAVWLSVSWWVPEHANQSQRGGPDSSQRGDRGPPPLGSAVDSQR